MRISWPDKYPSEADNYSVNWAPRLEDTEVITAKAFTLLSGSVVLGAAQHNGQVSWVKVSGGIPGLVEVLAEIVTADGDTLQEVAEFRILALPS